MAQQEYTHPEENDVLITARGNVSAELFYTAMSHREVFKRVSIQPRSYFVCQLNCFARVPSSRRRKAWHPGNDTWVSTELWAGEEEAEIFRLCLLPRQLPACPRERCQHRFKYLCIRIHGFSLHVYVCLCVDHSDLKVFYNLGTAELSPFSGPSPWNIHAAAKENQWK